MSKVILVMDKPEWCHDCPMCNSSDECVLQNESQNFEADTWDKLGEGCPLQELPKRKTVIGIDGATGMKELELHGRQKGWNACIDKILET